MGGVALEERIERRKGAPERDRAEAGAPEFETPHRCAQAPPLLFVPVEKIETETPGWQVPSC